MVLSNLETIQEISHCSTDISKKYNDSFDNEQQYHANTQYNQDTIILTVDYDKQRQQQHQHYYGSTEFDEEDKDQRIINKDFALVMSVGSGNQHQHQLEEDDDCASHTVSNTDTSPTTSTGSTSLAELFTPEMVIIGRVFRTLWKDPQSAIRSILLEDYSNLSDKIQKKPHNDDDDYDDNDIPSTFALNQLLTCSKKVNSILEKDILLSVSVDEEEKDSKNTLKDTTNNKNRISNNNSSSSNTHDNNTSSNNNTASAHDYTNELLPGSLESYDQETTDEVQRLQDINDLMEKEMVEMEDMNYILNTKIHALQKELNKAQFKNEVLEEQNRILIEHVQTTQDTAEESQQ